MKTIKNIDVKDKTILLRADLNVPLKNGKVESDLRIRASLPTIEYLLNHGAKQIVIISHLGRPDPQNTPQNLSNFSLSAVAKKLKSLLPNGTTFSFHNLPTPTQTKSPKLSSNQVILLENLRFDPREEQNSPEFAQELIDTIKPDIFVQDGFAVIHRAHTSTVALAQKLPTVAGLLVQKEVSSLQKALSTPEHPVLLIIGGAKVEDKEPLIQQFIDKADQIAVGGKIAADGYIAPNSHHSRVNNRHSEVNDRHSEINDRHSGPRPGIPQSNIYVAEDFDEDSTGKKLDIGPISTHKITESIKAAKTVIWNGLLGYAEDPAYATASTIVAETIGEKEDIFSVICGGDTTGFVEQICKEHPNLKYSLISTGGGAALEFLLGKDLPGLKVIPK